MPLMRSMAESESATAPLPTTLPSKPAPSTAATSCFCRHASTIYTIAMSTYPRKYELHSR